MIALNLCNIIVLFTNSTPKYFFWRIFLSDNVLNYITSVFQGFRVICKD